MLGYDSAGNVITWPGYMGGTATYTYDAENHLTQVAVPSGSFTYTYDGDGRRVKKSNGKLYWYGTGSDPLDETDLSGNTNNSSFKEFVFFNGKRIASRDYSNNVNYYFADHLGTARIVTNASGTPLDDSDFYPFGGERVISSSSGNTYKFTGKERDGESNLDNFDARYYSSGLGRFMSPDWSESPEAVPYGVLSNPQTLNLYAYVKNNPLKDTDPTGHSGDDDIVDHILNFVVSAGVTWVSDNLFGVGRPNPTTVEGSLGQSVGDFAATQSGMAEVGAAADLTPGALVLAGGGQEEALALPAGLAAHGTITAGIGATNLAKSALQDSSSGKPYENTPENQERMKQGKAPIGNDGKPVELHHEGQQANGQLTEKTQTEHRGGEDFKKNHPNTGEKPSQIDRNKFNQTRRKHWKDKANQQD